ncbi:MAG: hypothetical protein ABI183_08155 [Polyangiaceae bacterium]
MNSRRDNSLLDPDAPASEEEIAAAEELRLALADPSRKSEEADLARALSLANEPREIPQSVHDALVAKSLEKMAAKRASRAEGRGRVIRVAFGAATAFAIAASLFLFIRFNSQTSQPAEAAVAQIPLVQVHSTAPLFHEPFNAATASARIDRIAMARSDDLRENMYAQWGVK